MTQQKEARTYKTVQVQAMDEIQTYTLVHRIRKDRPDYDFQIIHGEMKKHKVIPRGEKVVIRGIVVGIGGLRKAFVHGWGWIHETEEVKLESMVFILNPNNSFENVRNQNQDYEVLNNLQKLKSIVAALPKNHNVELQEEETKLISAVASSNSIPTIAENVGLAESTTRDKLFGRRRNGAMIYGLLHKLEMSKKEEYVVVQG